MQAVNDTAFDVRSELIREIKKVFNHPTPFIIKSVRVRKSTKSKEGGHRRYSDAWVFINDEAKKGDPPAKYLFAQVQGGERPTKKFEASLMNIGRLSHGGFLVPARNMSRDKFGNISKETMTRMLSDLIGNKTGGKLGQKFIINTASNNKKSLGVWLRDDKNRGLTPVLIWKSALRGYKKALKMQDIAHAIVECRYHVYFKKRLENAIRTSK
jgi:hypothetical protein